MKIRDLTPTESRLLLTPYKLNGRDLVISTIKEMLFLGYLSIDEVTIHRFKHTVIKAGQKKTKEAESSYQLILNCISSHYNHYPKPVDKESALTPDGLLREVHGSLNFNYQKFKKRYVYRKLRDHKLVRPYFPFFKIRFPYSKEGKALKIELKELINELELYYKYYADTDKQKLQHLVKKLGANILLAYNVEVIMKELNLMRNTELDFKKDESIIGFDFIDYDFLELGWYISDMPSFDLPDISFGDFFDFN